MKLFARLLSIYAFILTFSGCNTRADQTLFTLTGAETGISFANTVNETEALNIISYEYLYNGAGIGAGDFNNDGLIDLFFTGNQVANKLYLNRGEWKFEDVTDKAGVSGRKGWRTGVAVADVNGDGLLDIYVCYSGPGANAERENQLFINNGGEIPVFKDKAHEYNLDAPGTYSTQATFFDFDLDGDLDMFLLNHAKITYSPFYNTKTLRNKRHPQFGNRLYRNDNGVFMDVSTQAGIHGSGINFGLGVSVSDLNLDGWPDVYVTNDYEEQDYFYINNTDGTFRECLQNSFRHISRFGMGSDIADFNNDGLPDVYVVDMLPEDNYRSKLLKGPDEYDKYMLLRDSGYHHQNMRNMLQLNLGNNDDGIPQFSEIGQLAGVAATDWSWCPLFADLDNDGWKDLFVTNGYLRDYTNLDFLKYTFEEFRQKSGSMDTVSLISQMPSTHLSNYCFRNTESLQFENVTSAWGLDSKTISNGAVLADLDNDGDKDIVISNVNERAHIYRNNTEKTEKHFIKIALTGHQKNLLGVGAKVYVKTDAMVQLQENYPTRGFQSSCQQPLSFGLGQALTVSEIIVAWPDQTYSKLLNVPVDTLLTIAQGTHVFDSTGTEVGNMQKPFLEIVAPKSPPVHTENAFVDFKHQYLLPYQLSSNGPAVAKADVNGDGFDDYYFGGAAGQAGVLFISQQKGGTKILNGPWQEDRGAEDTDAVFIDVDNDNDMDLFVVSGGNEFTHENPSPLQDRLYLNEGGVFKRAVDALPGTRFNGSCVAAADFDHDGDTDLFVGGKSLPGNFPLPANSQLLRNDTRDGIARFTDVTPGLLKRPGMVSSAVWVDVDKDTWSDLVITGDFMPVLMFRNRTGNFGGNGNAIDTIGASGLWSRLHVVDIDNDGDADILGGNAGINTTFRASKEEPMQIVFHDFNGDGTIDPILTFYVQGKREVYWSRDELTEQLPHLKKRFLRYSDYAASGLEEILDGDELKRAKVIDARTLRSALFVNNGNGTFTPRDLPLEAQISRINAFITSDFNHDGLQDILLAGNFYPYRVQIGRDDAGSGLLLMHNPGGSFNPQGFRKSGFYATGDVRSLTELNLSDGRYVLVGRNNDTSKFFKIKPYEIPYP